LHQPGDPFAAAPQALAQPQLGVDPRRPVAAPRHLMDGGDRGSQLLIRLLPGGRATAAPLIET